MPTVDSKATPAPARDAAAGRPSRRLSLGGDAGGPASIPADFQFTYYVERMLVLIESNWYKPPVPVGTRATVRFTITRGGRLEGIQVEAGSGIPTFDRAALRALYGANPLPPLPHGYRKDRLTVHLTFSE
jgi:TonB family protein